MDTALKAAKVRSRQEVVGVLGSRRRGRQSTFLPIEKSNGNLSLIEAAVAFSTRCRVTAS